jgi:hypothetical protein
MEPNLLTRDVAIRLTEISLGMAGRWLSGTNISRDRDVVSATYSRTIV